MPTRLPLLYRSLKVSLINCNQIEEKEIIHGYKARFVHSEYMTIVYWNVEANKGFPSHTHEHEQIATVQEGEFELTIDGVTKILKPGLIAVIPPNAPHSGRSITDCKLMDVFYPLRSDYQ